VPAIERWDGKQIDQPHGGRQYGRKLHQGCKSKCRRLAGDLGNFDRAAKLIRGRNVPITSSTPDTLQREAIML
jgi:hypothetical protein